MKSALMIFLLLVLTLLTAGQSGSAEPRTVLWDTCKRFHDGDGELMKREGWQAVSPDRSAAYAMKGDAVVENDRLQVLFAAGCEGVVVYGRSDAGNGPRRMCLVPLSVKREPCPAITSLKIADADGDEVTLEVSSRSKSGDTARTAITLGPGRSFVKIRPVENAAALRVGVRARFAVLPDFFGDDILLDPRKSPGTRLFVPAENMVLGFAGEGNTILTCVWPSGDQEVQAVLGGEGEDRRFEALEISFDNKSLYLAVLDAPGIWHGMTLERASDAEKDVETGWKRPFDARWRGDFRLRDRSDSWDFETQRRDRVGVPPFGTIVWPFWFDKEKAMIRLIKPDYLGVALIYPLERKRGTPLSVLTPVDVLREALGTGPCEYILDREGLGTRNPGGDRNLVSTGVCNTTGVMQHFFEQGIECKEGKLVRDLADDVQAFNITVRQRLEEYRAFARQLTRECNDAQRANPALKPVADLAAGLEQRLEELYAKRLPAMKSPEENIDLVQKIKDLTREEDPENLGKYLALAAQLRNLAGTQDSLAGMFRVEVRRFRRELGAVDTSQSAVAKLVEKLREQGRNILRKKHYTEGA
jgi:hypothetical protein